MAPSAASILPIVKTFKDCSSFEATVLPFVPQLQALPYRVFESISSLDDLKYVYLTTNPLMSAFAFSLALAPIFLVVSEINRNYSQVDRMWSILPTVYNVHYAVWAHMAGVHTARLDQVRLFSLIWSARLTFNYWRRGGYNIGSEDYRWEVLQQKISPALFFVFNVAFISFLLFLVTTPTYVLLLASQIKKDELAPEDVYISTFMIGLVALTFLADQQQYNFQEAKKVYQKTAKTPEGYKSEDLDRGFNVRGLWGWSRHPNFASEQSIWVTLYQWSAFATYSFYNWTAIGAISYLILFQASTWFTELITAGKYPEYKEYQKRVSKFLPKLTAPFTEAMPEVIPGADRMGRKSTKASTAKSS